MRPAAIAVLAVLATVAVAADVSDRPWMNVGDSPAARAQALVGKMNLTEKINMVHGWSGGYVGNVIENTRLGIPALNLNDGPQGFRYNAGPGTTTQWPSGLTVGASWDVDVLKSWGTAMGEEFVGKGANVQLGPGVCIARVPHNGRNFEYLSGEDPYLGYKLVQPAVAGIQSQGVIANAKHYILNNQETNRGNVSANVDERTVMEIYEGPFAGAVEAGVASTMCSYNRIDGTHACESATTLNKYLKTYLNYTYWVMSDWGATHSTQASAINGLDQEMPSGTYFGDALMSAINSGSIAMSVLDDKVTRILSAMFAVGLFDTPQPTGSISANVTSAAHNRLARTLASEAGVLMKNNGLLPLDKTKIKKYAVIGAQAATSIITGGGGSGSVVPYYQSAPLQALIEEVGAGDGPASPNCQFLNQTDFYQPGNPSAPATSAQDCCDQCFNRPGCTAFAFSTGTTCWFKSSTAGRRSDPVVTAGTCSPNLPSNIAFNDGSDKTAAATAAKDADVALVFVATTSHEGADRTTLSLPDGVDDMVSAVVAAQPNTVVVIVTPGALLTPWSDGAAAVLNMFMPGQEYGHAVVDLLFGTVNPSGRLPLTFPNIENEQQFTHSQWPGLPYPGTPLNADYSEKLNVGYRWYNTHNVDPKFAFGHGLSYTTFSYSNLVVSDRTVTVTVTNTGSVAGKDVPQMYLTFPTSAGEPPAQLRGFEKVYLQPGASTTVSFTLTDKMVSVWDTTSHSWQQVHGTFTVQVGASSRDLKLSGSVTN